MSGGRRSLWLIWAALLVLVGLIAWVQLKDRVADDGDGHGHGAQGSRSLLPLSMSEVGGIEVATDGQLHRFERDAQGKWFYHGAHAAIATSHAHQTDPALSERIGKIFAGLDNARMEREVPLDKEKDLYGVVVPKMILIIYKPKDTQPVAQFAIGDLAPDGLSRYVHLVGSNRVITLPQYHIENVMSAIRAASGAVPLVLPQAGTPPVTK